MDIERTRNAPVVRKKTRQQEIMEELEDCEQFLDDMKNLPSHMRSKEYEPIIKSQMASVCLTLIKFLQSFTNPFSFTTLQSSYSMS